MSCIFKELIVIMRDVPLLVFTLILPIMQLSVGLITFGGNPSGLSIAVVDYDTSNRNESLSNQYLRYFGIGDWTDIKHCKSLQSGNRILLVFFLKKTEEIFLLEKLEELILDNENHFSIRVFRE